MGGLRVVGEGRRLSAAVCDHGGEGVPRRGMVKMGGAEFATPSGTGDLGPGPINRAGADPGDRDSRRALW